MTHSLEVFFKDQIIFYSDGKWLHPLFELEDFLSKSDYNPSTLLVKDKIIGRAAALILAHFGIKNVHAQILSSTGKDALELQGIKFKFNELVDRVICRTEKMLQEEHNPEVAYQLIKSLIKS